MFIKEGASISPIFIMSIDAYVSLNECNQSTISYVLLKSYLKMCVWRTQVVSSWSRRLPVRRWSYTEGATPLQRERARSSAPGSWSWPARRRGLTPGSWTGIPPGGGKRGSRCSSTGQRLPTRDCGSWWSHTQAGCTDCSGTASEPGVSPTGSWGTYRSPGSTGGLTLRWGSGNQTSWLMLWRSVFTLV